MVRGSGLLMVALRRARAMGLRDWRIVSGAVYNTVWNVLTGREPLTGIKDVDLFYWDDGDLSYEAEDAVIRRGALVFAGLPLPVEIRNQARVHLWFDERNGTSGYPRLTSARHGIDVFLETPGMLGIHPTGGGAFDVYAPLGYGDLFGFVHRRNPGSVGPEAHYVEKSARRKAHYPRLTVVVWDGM
jgi:hypothetical protein